MILLTDDVTSWSRRLKFHRKKLLAEIYKIKQARNGFQSNIGRFSRILGRGGLWAGTRVRVS